MILTNFSIANDFIALEHNGSYLDLHNNFDFIDFEHIEDRSRVILRWQRTKDAWIANDVPFNLRLLFSEVYLFKCTNRENALSTTDDTCLSSIGFIWNDMIENMEGFSNATPKEGCEHLTMCLESGFAIKIGAKKVRCETDNGT
ncbi:hypothetical protein ISG33_13905 [Glaciecola sp. MH2013]|uniref:hypothetical protein n=1 Tax=Glaciecola sp. MH2013 TaxID=2785524 RepID=UPI00189E9FC9|nr:hypothetical protein [Glaciecola sp. MH2013]MBF7074496.1 hypothetical protein [Glaciecola sp. MH2013]